MPRRPNTKSTSIYWLVDTRTGLPFYCGKTVKNPNQRLIEHKSNSPRHPNRPLCARLIELGDNVHIQVIMVVPCGEDWREAERRWIWRLRSIYLNIVNISNGGDGTPGYIPTPETRAKMRAAKLGRPRTPETRAKIAIASAGRKHTAETRAKMSAIAKLRPPPVDENGHGYRKGKTWKPTHEHLERRRLNQKPPTEEGRAKMSAASAAYWGAPENRKRKSETFIAYWASSENREKRRQKRAAQNV